MDAGNRFALILVRERTKRGITQEEAAELCGITPATYSRWENLKRTPSIKRAERVLKAFGISMTLGAGNETP